MNVTILSSHNGSKGIKWYRTGFSEEKMHFYLKGVSPREAKREAVIQVCNALLQDKGSDVDLSKVAKWHLYEKKEGGYVLEYARRINYKTIEEKLKHYKRGNYVSYSPNL